MERFVKQNATDHVVKTIRDRIQSGELQVGDRLPNEKELAENLGVGRSSLREGIKILHAYGVVESRQGEGTFIVDHVAENFFTFLGFHSSKEEMINFLELRRVLEVGNISEICSKIDDETIRELEGYLVQFEQSGLTHGQYCELDKEFHTRLIEYTKNPMLIQVNKMITAMRSDLLDKLFQHEDILTAAQKAHRRIVEAIKSRDSELCVRAVSEHLDETMAFLNTL